MPHPDPVRKSTDGAGKDARRSVRCGTSRPEPLVSSGKTGQYSPCPRRDPRPQAQPHRGGERGAAYQAATSRIACEMMSPAGFSTPRAYTDVGRHRPCRRDAPATSHGLGPMPELKHRHEPAEGSSVFWRHLGCRSHQPKTVRILLRLSTCGRRHQQQPLEAGLQERNPL